MVVPGWVLVAAYVVSGGVELSLAGVALFRGHSNATRWFVALTALSAVWAFLVGVASLGLGPRVTVDATVAGLVLSTTLPVVWAVFVSEYLGRRLPDRPLVLAGLCVVPALTVVALLTNGVYGLAWTGVDVVERHGIAVADFAFTPWILVQYLYTNVVFVGGLVAIHRSIRQYDAIYVRQAGAMGLGTAVPLLAGLVGVVDSGVGGVNYIPMSLGLTGVCFGYALFEAGLLDFDPAPRHVGEQTVIEGFEDGVVVVDRRGRIVSLNPRAATILDVDRAAALGESIQTVAPRFPTDPDVDRVQCTGRDGRRYEMVRSAFAGHTGRVFGHSFVFRDVTDRETQRQRLDVLNRALRHNLRNDMNVVAGYADLVAAEERNTPESRESAATIREAAERLVAIGEKARAVEEVLTDGDATVAPVSVRRLVEDVTRTVAAENPDVETSVDVSPGLSVETDRRVFRAVVANVVENAAVHNDSPTPKVTVRAWVDGEGRDADVVVEVADNGGGIPEAEYGPVTRGSEDDLHHGSGLGLWLVHWGARALGGSVEFDLGTDATDGGTDADSEFGDETGAVVRLRVPASRTREGAQGDAIPDANQGYF